MEYTLDLGRMVSALKKADSESSVPKFIETEGEKYIYDNVIAKYMSKQPIYVGDIDFDAFEEDAEEVFKKMGDAPYSHGLMVAAFQLFQRYKKYGR